MFAVNEPRLPLGFLKGLCIYYFLIGIIPMEWIAQIENDFLGYFSGESQQRPNGMRLYLGHVELFKTVVYYDPLLT